MNHKWNKITLISLKTSHKHDQGKEHSVRAWSLLFYQLRPLSKEKKKKLGDHSCTALVCEIKFHSIQGRWHGATRRLDCLNKHLSFLIFTDAGISLLWCVWHNQLVLEILVSQQTMSCSSARQCKETAAFCLTKQTHLLRKVRGCLSLFKVYKANTVVA